MIKKLNILIYDNCRECPYCRYDSYYDMSINSGYDCWHDNTYMKRIATDKGDTETLDNTPIPDWCPLETVE